MNLDPADPRKTRLLEHNYDGIQEYDNPLPGWWVYLFYATIVFSVLYCLNVPGVGTGRGRIANYEHELEQARAARAALAATNPAPQDSDESLLAAAHEPTVVALGKAVFDVTCSACHRPDGGGNIGPNLTDEFWIHGNRPTEILDLVATGVVDKGMPAWGQTLPAAKVRAAAVYVLTLRGTHPPAPKAPQGTRAPERPS